MAEHEIPAIVYAARSRAEEAGKDSTGDQVAVILRRLASEPGRVVRGEPHVDHASGYHGNRGPRLESAIREATEAAREHGRAELWVFKSERLGRGSGRKDEARSVMEVYVECRRAGVDLRSVEDDAFLTNPMLVGVADEMAHKYSRDLAAHTKRGIDAHVAKGKPWGAPGFGYRRGDDGHWLVDEHEARIARRAFAEYLERTPSFCGVARVLNAAGLQPRRAGKLRKDGRRSSTQWASNVIKRLLTSRHVLGEFEHLGEWHQGQHEPLIDEHTWHAVQRIVAQGAKYSPKGSGRTPNTHVFVRGLLRCGICGEAMLPRSDPGRYDVYVCRSRKTGRGCTMPILRRQQVETAALELFEKRAFDYEATREHVAQQLDSRIADVQAQAEQAERAMREAEARLARVKRDYTDGRIDADDWREFRAELGAERDAARAEAERLRSHVDELARTLGNLDAESETLRRLAGLREAIQSRVTGAGRDVDALRAAMAAVFDHIEVCPDENDELRFLVLPVVHPSLGGAIRITPAKAPIAFRVEPPNNQTSTSHR